MVMKIYSGYLNFKNYYNKKCITVNYSQNTPAYFDHTYLIILDTFWFKKM